MKLIITVLSLVVLGAVSGCSKTTFVESWGTLAAPGQSMAGKTTGTQSLSPPIMSTRLTVGEARAATIAMKRADNTGQNVTLKIIGPPKDGTFDPMFPLAREGDLDAKVMPETVDNSEIDLAFTMNKQ